MKSYTIGRALVLALVASAAGLLVVAPGNAAQQVATRLGYDSLLTSIVSSGTYQHWMLALIIGVPALLFLMMSLVPRMAPRRMWIPNAVYWLAPERRSRTIAYLERQAVVLGVVVIAFLCALHWLMTGADAALSRERTSISLAVLLVFLAAACWIWLMSVQSRFRRITQVAVGKLGTTRR